MTTRRNSDAIGGVAATFVTFRAWDEGEFRYRDYSEHAPGDRRADYAALHNPPLLIMLSIRLDPYPPIHPTRTTIATVEDFEHG